MGFQGIKISVFFPDCPCRGWPVQNIAEQERHLGLWMMGFNVGQSRLEFVFHSIGFFVYDDEIRLKIHHGAED